MEKRNLFVSGKAVVAAVCGAFTAAFGWLGWLVVAWAACMALLSAALSRTSPNIDVIPCDTSAMSKRLGVVGGANA